MATPITAMTPPIKDLWVGRSPSIQRENGITVSGVNATIERTIPVLVVARAH